MMLVRCNDGGREGAVGTGRELRRWCNCDYMFFISVCGGVILFMFIYRFTLGGVTVALSS